MFIESNHPENHNCLVSSENWDL